MVRLVRNWTNVEERQRLCLIYAGNPLRDDSIKMSQVGLKEGDTMHGFYKSAPTDPTAGQSASNNNASGTFQNDLEDDDFDELARYFLPLAGSLLGKKMSLNDIIPAIPSIILLEIDFFLIFLGF